MVILRKESILSSSSGGTYDVFLSFTYADVGKKFVDHLYSALCNEFRIFRHNENMEKVENIKSELHKIIKESRMSIVVFSKSYASSSRCLDELEMILQHKTSFGGHHVLPIFYDVDPSHVRRQMGSFKEAFESYEEGERENGWKSRVEGWKAALRVAADIAGRDLQNDANGHEGKFIQKIVEEVREKLDSRVLSMPAYSIGIDSRAEYILSWLNDGSRDVGMLAICGMGGLGKTTIAKFVYNNHILSRFQPRFQGSSFLANIAQQNDLTTLQTQLLSDIKARRERVNNVDEGIIKIQNILKCKSVLLVLDDVGTQEHLEAMVGNYDWLHAGSKIIITTRNKQLIRAHKSCVAYQLQILNPKESLELFSWHAFGQNKPNDCFKEISEKLVNHFEGLPLAISIVGSSLSGSCSSIWEDTYKKLVAFPHRGIHEKLKISFDLLDGHDKELFLHIACFFPGYDKDHVVPILEECGFHTNVGFQNLIDKCLLTIQSKSFGEEKMLAMHQLVREMGREIVRQESFKDPGNRSRIWNNKDSLHILQGKSGTVKIEGFILNIQKSENRNLDGSRKCKFQDAFDKSFLHNLRNWVTSTTLGNSCEVAFETEAFAMMCNLKFLMINYVQLNGSYKNFPKGLRWLCWHGSPLQSIPSDFYLEKLVILEMPYSSLRSVWTGAKNLNCLKTLNLSDSYNLIKTPNFSLVVNLEKLILENCTSLVEIHESVKLLEKLVLLNLRNCAKLSNIPKSIGGLNLQTFDISGCTNLEEWPRLLENIKSLQVLKAGGVGKVKTQYSSIWPWSLKLNKSFRISFTYLPASLVHLSLVDCNLQDDALPTDIIKMSLLKYLNLSNNLICSLPDCFTRLTRLEDLILSSCTELRSITKLPMKSLKILDVKECLLLERVTSWLLPTIGFEIDYNGCKSLVKLFNHFKVEAIENVDKEIINNLLLSNWESLEITNMKIYQYRINSERLVLQECHSIYRGGSKHRIFDYDDDMEFNIFSTYFPGNEVPRWYNFKKEGSSMHLNVPFYGDKITVQGLNVCFVYALSDEDKGFSKAYPFPTMIMNLSSGKMFQNSARWFIGVSKTSQDMIDLSYWKLEHDDLRGGDVLFIRVQETGLFSNVELKVKEIGVHILFRECKGKSLQFACKRKFNKISSVRLCQSFLATMALNIPLQVEYLIEPSFRHNFTEYHLESEVPRWFEFRSRGPSIELAVPLYHNFISGLIVCSIFTLPHHDQDIYYDDGQQYMTSTNKKSKEGFWNNMYKWVIGDKETTQDIMELSYWEISYYRLQSMEKLHVEVLTNNEYFKVKEIGVELIYEEYEDSELPCNSLLREEPSIYINSPHNSKENRIQIISEESKEGQLSPEVCVIGEPYATIHNYKPDNYKFALNTNVNTRDFDDHFLRGFKDVVYGGVLRDGEGKWILGYYGRMGDGRGMAQGFSENYNAVDIEVMLVEWVIYIGLTIILEKGWSNILIRNDNWPAVIKLHNITTSDVCTPGGKYGYYYEPTASRNMVLKDILFLCSRCNCTLSYICPVKNKLAKLIAELGKGSDDELVILENPPDDLEIKDIILAETKMKSFT